MSAKKTAFYGMFLALALVAGYIEQLIPINLGIPGVKLGLANIVTMLLLYIVGVPAACLISVLRILLSGFLFGSGFAMVYSAAFLSVQMDLFFHAVLPDDGKRNRWEIAYEC